MFLEIQLHITCSIILICTYQVNLPRNNDFPEWLIKANKDWRFPYEVYSVAISTYKEDANGQNGPEACNN